MTIGMECPKCGESMTTMIHLGPNGAVGWTEKCFFCEYARGNTAIPENMTRDLKNETAMPTPKGTRTIKQSRINKLIAAGMLMLGLVFLALSAFYNSCVSSFVGLGLTFWGALLLYVTPTKHVNLELLNATLKPALLNTEEMLAHFKLNEKGM